MNAAREPHSWPLGEWMVFPNSNELVHRDGRRERVEGRLMRVLEMLYEARGEVVTTRDLLRRIWDRKVVTPHSVATAISELRRVLGDDPHASKYIETIPRRGYRLRALASVDAPTSLAPSAAQPARRVRFAMFALLSVVAAALGLALYMQVDTRAPVSQAAVDSTITAQYVRARQLWSRREHESVQEARRLLHEIVERAPGFAAAHAALADIYAHKTGDDLGLPELETFRLAQRHLDAARAIEPNLTETHVTQALLDFYRDHQPDKGLAAVDAALAIDAHFAYAWQTRAMLLSVLGRHEESLEAIARARALDPASSSIGWDEVWFLYLADAPERALAAYERETRTSAPNYLFAALIHHSRGEARRALDSWLSRLARRGAVLPNPHAVQQFATQGDYEHAYAELMRQVQSIEAYTESAVVLAAWEHLSGDTNAARARLARIQSDRRNWLSLWAHEIPLFDAHLPARSTNVAAAAITKLF